MELSPNSKHMVVGSNSGRRSFLSTSLGMMLTLALRSHNDFSNLNEPMEHGRGLLASLVCLQ
jgi:recombinational DNA repair ATPase RecF